MTVDIEAEQNFALNSNAQQLWTVVKIFPTDELRDVAAQEGTGVRTPSPSHHKGDLLDFYKSDEKYLT